MKRRESSLAAPRSLRLALGALRLPAWAQAAAQGRQGLHQAAKPASTEAPAGKVEVVEFFWYSCPHCNAFEPQFEAWARRPPDVVVRRVPVAFNASFVPQQKLYYALEGMGKLDASARQGVPRHPRGSQSSWPGRRHLDWVASRAWIWPSSRRSTTPSPWPTRRARPALQNAYDVEGVPAMGVAGRYYTDGTMAGNMENVLRVVDAWSPEPQGLSTADSALHPKARAGAFLMGGNAWLQWMQETCLP
jgi:thiol:disulfide interchange protein DsbA